MSTFLMHGKCAVLCCAVKSNTQHNGAGRILLRLRLRLRLRPTYAIYHCESLRLRRFGPRLSLSRSCCIPHPANPLLSWLGESSSYHTTPCHRNASQRTHARADHFIPNPRCGGRDILCANPQEEKCQLGVCAETFEWFVTNKRAGGIGWSVPVRWMVEHRH